MKKILITGLSACLLAVNTVADEQLNVEAKYQQLMEGVCAENSAPVQRSSGTSVYSWKDENGQVHFGDRAPQNVDAEKHALAGRKDYFDVSVSYPSGPIDSNIGEALAIGGRAIADSISRLLPAGTMAKSEIDMQVFGSRNALMKFMYEETGSASSQADGFYLPLNNKVAVLYRGSDSYAQQVALHESTHVFQFQNIGFMPGWVTEGMAEYFEMLEVSGSAKLVPVNQSWIAYIQNQGRLIPLQTLMTADHSAWQGSQAGQFYASSWALFYFMMLPENRAMTQQLLADMSQDKCDEVPDAHYMDMVDDLYRGGLEKLENDWVTWFNGSHLTPNYH
ncbi:DUF1570 domain-containing protein [Reinekea marinisedimentorum]|uniref:Uncharacterized protein DUF4124 n=1 Tax=Reinekea marinisedimentorum TaxID=230495 RepID=A0A4R3HZU2_9GAMM|nr:DUF1570 domain-containing protein [Reinekea marinisedimentorum]TCS38782.1 uncharacterized protein DUF4124 [Reinekea marinisedimentorum]